MIRRCLTRTWEFIAQLFHHHYLSVCVYCTCIVGQRNLALGLISSTVVTWHITALVGNVHAPHTRSHTHVGFAEGKKKACGSQIKKQWWKRNRQATVCDKSSLQLQQQANHRASSPTFTLHTQRCTTDLLWLLHLLPLTANLLLKESSWLTCISK